MDRQVRAAQAYIALGWRVFAVNRDKIPFRNCDNCQPGRCPGGEACTCSQFCHAFYAATTNADHVRAMLWRAGDGAQLAIRTGRVSGIFAIDAEATDGDEYGFTGLEILDEWEKWAGTELPDTLRARTAGGGLHMLYKLPDGKTLQGRNRFLPNVDLKADGGYIVAPPAEGRRWLNWNGGHTMEYPGDAMFAYLSGVSGRSSGRGGSGSLSLRSADVIPAGARYEFTRDLVYHLRRSGRGWDESLRICREYWDRFQQPPEGMRVHGGVWYLPFTQMEYELTRAWARVQPEEPLSFQQMSWAQGINGKKG